MSLLSISLILFLIMDPVGNITCFLNLMKEIDPKRQRWVTFREMMIALFAMFAFYFIGDFLLDLLQVSETTVRLSSGTILFLVAVRILFPGASSLRANLQMSGEPFIVPLAIPLIAGPSLLATIMLYAHLDHLQAVLIPAILIAWFCAICVLLLSSHLQRILGNNGLMACERLMGMILVLLAIQRFLEGIVLFFAERQVPLLHE